jgi:hypothetical protein
VAPRGERRRFDINIRCTEVEVHTVLSGGGIGHLLKAEPGSFRQSHRREVVGEQLLRRTIELLGPPSAQLRGIAAVEGDHLHVETRTARPYAHGEENACSAADDS